MMKKLILVVSLLGLAGCQQLMHGQTQPVKLIDAKNNVYFTSCGGAVEDWASCYDKATATCKGSYSLVSKTDNSRGTQRDITFKCN